MKSKTSFFPICLLSVFGVFFPSTAPAENERVVFATSFDQPDEYATLGIEEINAADQGRNDDSSFRLKQRRWTFPARAIPINPALKYRFEVAFKAAPGSENTRVVLVLKFCDKNGIPISNYSILPVAGTQSVLKSDAAVNAREVLLENSGQTWPTDGSFALAFDVQDDLSDIPNQNVFKIDSVRVEKDGLLILLEDALESDYPAGTPVRWHQLADPPMIHATANDQWELHSMTIAGQASPGDSHREMRGKFWPGTSSILFTPRFYERNPETGQKEVLVDDLRIVELTKIDTQPPP